MTTSKRKLDLMTRSLHRLTDLKSQKCCKTQLIDFCVDFKKKHQTGSWQTRSCLKVCFSAIKWIFLVFLWKMKLLEFRIWSQTWWFETRRKRCCEHDEVSHRWFNIWSHCVKAGVHRRLERHHEATVTHTLTEETPELRAVKLFLTQFETISLISSTQVI